MLRLACVVFLVLFSQNAIAGSCCIFDVKCDDVESLYYYRGVASVDAVSHYGQGLVERSFGFIVLNESGFERMSRKIESCESPSVVVMGAGQILERGPSHAKDKGDGVIVIGRDTEEEVLMLLHKVCPQMQIHLQEMPGE